MPVTPSATRKLRVDRIREGVNTPVLSRMKKALKKAKLEPSGETIKAAYSSVDKALKKNIIKRNRAARLKSRLVAQVKSKSKSSYFSKTTAKSKSSKTKAIKSKK